MTFRRSNMTATGSTPIFRLAAPCAGTVRSTCATPSNVSSTAWRANSDWTRFAVRRANLLQAPTRTLNDLMVNSYGLAQCLDKVERASQWRERAGRMPPGKGLGMACSHYVSGSAKPIHFTGEPHAVVNLRLDFDGGITALTGAADIGQGSSTMVAIAVAETLDVSLDRIRVIAGDLAVTPKDNGAYSSRITFMVGNAAIDAARQMKAMLVAAAARKLEARPEQVECIGGTFRVGAGDQSALPFAEIVAAALVDEGAITVKGTFTCPPEFPGGRASAAAPSELHDGFQLRRPGRRGGHRRCDRAGDDRQGMGRARLRPCDQSARGGWKKDRGIGMDGNGPGAMRRDPLSRRLAGACEFSRISHADDGGIPPIEVHIVESHDPFGPFGAKEASEGALAGFPPAMVNAIANAIGIDFDELPVTPDRVVEALIQRRRKTKLAPYFKGRIVTTALAECVSRSPSPSRRRSRCCLSHREAV